MDKFQNFISCFQEDVGPISKIFKKFLDGSPSFFGARLFKFDFSRGPDMRQYYFQDVPIYFIISVGVFLV